MRMSETSGVTRMDCITGREVPAARSSQVGGGCGREARAPRFVPRSPGCASGAVRVGVCGWAVLLALASSAAAEIVSISASADAVVREFVGGAAGDEVAASDTFPGTADELPLQVFARLLSTHAEAAGAVAAQFADPTELNQPNPEEFAVNLALFSADPSVYFEGEATLVEVREVVFNPGEVFAAEGTTVPVIGRFFLDGAMAIYARTGVSDLAGASVRLNITITQVTSEASQTVFSGSLEIAGSSDGQAAVAASGDIPTDALILSDLSGVADEFGTFRVLVLPNLEIDYEYEAVVGETFELRATVEMDGASPDGGPGGVGVAGLLGTPTDAIAEVIGATQGSDLAQRTIDAMDQERDDPSGVPAFDVPGLDVCGPVGFGSSAALMSLALLGAAGRRRR